MPKLAERYDVDIGAHRFGFEPPHFVRLYFTGDIEAHEAQAVIDNCARISAGKPFAIILETPGLKNVTPGARKVFADGFRGQPLVAAAFLKASLRVRATATFVTAAINVFRARNLALGFFADEETARAWATAQLSTW